MSQTTTPTPTSAGAGRSALSLAALPPAAWVLAAGAALAVAVVIDAGRVLLRRT